MMKGTFSICFCLFSSFCCFSLTLSISFCFSEAFRSWRAEIKSVTTAWDVWYATDWYELAQDWHHCFDYSAFKGRVWLLKAAKWILYWILFYSRYWSVFSFEFKFYGKNPLKYTTVLLHLQASCRLQAITHIKYTPFLPLPSIPCPKKILTSSAWKAICLASPTESQI